MMIVLSGGSSMRIQGLEDGTFSHGLQMFRQESDVGLCVWLHYEQWVFREMCPIHVIYFILRTPRTASGGSWVSDVGFLGFGVFGDFVLSSIGTSLGLVGFCLWAWDCEIERLT
ncbi:hypothetical protein Dimus_018818, partial [Dionaea muscipula]